MGTDFNIRPVGAPVATLLVRPGPDATRTAVPTDLPPDKSVTASDNSSATTTTASYPSTSGDQVAHQVIVDRDAAQIVFQTIDKTTNLVVSQYPEESKLRARAYLRSLDDAKLEKKALATDRMV